MMPAALAGLAHVDHCFPNAGEGATEVDVDDRVEVVVAHLPQHRVAEDAGVGDEDVESAVRVDGRPHELLRGLGGPDRGDDRDGDPAGGLDGGDRLRGGLGIDVVHDDRGTSSSELLGIREPEATARAGDDGDFAFK